MSRSSNSPTVSALVTVYHRISPADLTWSLGSLLHQTQPAEQVVIVADGPLGSTELQSIIDGFIAEYATATGQRAQLVCLPDNQGSAVASNAGLAVCTEEFIARLDADDIAAPERFEKQRAFLAQHPDVDVLGTAVAEFGEEELASIYQVRPGELNIDVDRLAELRTTTRTLPRTHEEIARYISINSPINHPSSIIRRSALATIDGYQHVYFMEDYDLWARLLTAGFHLHNLDEALTYFRFTDSTFNRRTGAEMFRAERKMQARLRQYGLISAPRSMVNLIIRSAYRALPKPALRRAYRILFQRTSHE